MALTIADIPKDVLVNFIVSAGFTVPEELIAGVIIEARLGKAKKFHRQHNEKMAASGKIGSVKKRRQMEIEARRCVLNGNTLIESARKLAAQYGLTEKYFAGE